MLISIMSQRARKTTWLASLGAGLEYYDFIVYGMMVAYLNTLFFSSSELWINQMKAFGAFAVGYIARPFGGVIFGMIGDTFGRKSTFLSVMMLMTGATFAMGCLPTRDQIGESAAVLLVALRVLQGLSFGAELPGAITVVHEHAGKNRRALYSGFVISSVGLGSLLASLILFILSRTLTTEQILQWGWRMPFLFGGLLAFANYLIRKQMHETPEFLQWDSKRSRKKSIKEPLLLLMRRYRTNVFTGIGMTVFLAGLIIFSLYLPTYLSTYFAYTPSTVYLAMTYGLAWSAVTLPLFGYLADRWGALTLFLIASLGFIPMAFPLFHLLAFGNLAALILFMMLYQTAISASIASYFPLLSSGFPTEARYTGIALCYNIVYALMGMAPILITFLIYRTQPNIAIWFLICCALISAASGFYARKRTEFN